MLYTGQRAAYKTSDTGKAGNMIVRDDILSMEYLKKSEYTGCHGGMRYRLEGVTDEDGKFLLATVWPEPFNFFTTPEERKQRKAFSFAEEGVAEAIAWMNERYEADKKVWENGWNSWKEYRMK